MLRFDAEFCDKLGIPKYFTCMTGGVRWKKVLASCSPEMRKKLFDYSDESLLPCSLTEVLNGMFHHGLGVAKSYAARIAELMKACGHGEDSIAAWVRHLRTCNGVYVRMDNIGNCRCKTITSL